MFTSRIQNCAAMALLTFVIALGYSRPAVAGSYVFELSPKAASVLTQASTCYQDLPGQGPTLFYAAIRKSTRARGLMTRQWLWWPGGPGGSGAGWVLWSEDTHYTWSYNIAIYQMPFYPHSYTEFFILIAEPKRGLIAYPITNVSSFPIPNSCG